MKIAVMGSAPSSVAQAPFADNKLQAFRQGPVQHYPPLPHANEEWDIWGCSPGLFGAATRMTRWFELHRWEPGQPWFSPEYVQWMQAFNGPVYVGGQIPDHAMRPQNAVIYPLKEIDEEFSCFFLTSSLALMQALAILTIEDLRKLRKIRAAGNLAGTEEFGRLRAWGMPEAQLHAEIAKEDDDDTIGLWGVDMSANEEYARQRPGCWYFGLQTLERGIGLYYPPESDLMIPEPVYGLSEWDHSYIKATVRMKELTARLQRSQAQMGEAQREMDRMVGAIDAENYRIKYWMNERNALAPGVVLRRPKVR